MALWRFFYRFLSRVMAALPGHVWTLAAVILLAAMGAGIAGYCEAAVKPPAKLAKAPRAVQFLMPL
jgi:hypothetical protein